VKNDHTDMDGNFPFLYGLSSVGINGVSSPIVV
jgi:hypothetical protein